MQNPSTGVRDNEDHPEGCFSDDYEDFQDYDDPSANPEENGGQSDHDEHDEDDFAELRKSIDGNDQFMRGHRVCKPRGGLRKNPTRDEWAFNDKEVERFLSSIFPLAGAFNVLNDVCVCRRGRRTCVPCVVKNQAYKKKRWLMVIRLYFRMQKSLSTTVFEMWSLLSNQPYDEKSAEFRKAKENVRRIVKSIRDARVRPKVRKGHRPRGIKESAPRRKYRRNRFLSLERSIRQSVRRSARI